MSHQYDLLYTLLDVPEQPRATEDGEGLCVVPDICDCHPTAQLIVFFTQKKVLKKRTEQLWLFNEQIIVQRR